MDASHLRSVLSEWSDRLSSISEQESLKVVGSKWTRKQVLGHLIDSMANNHQRFVRLQQGNLLGFPGYEQEQWVDAGDYNRASWSDLIKLWTLYGLQLARVIENIDQSCKGNQWEGHDVDLRFLVQDFTRHMVHHLNQIS
jgi:hypothetical protein